MKKLKKFSGNVYVRFSKSQLKYQLDGLLDPLLSMASKFAMPVLKNVFGPLALSVASLGIHRGIMRQSIENNKITVKMTLKEFQDYHKIFKKLEKNGFPSASEYKKL